MHWNGLWAFGRTAIEVRTVAQRLRPNDPPVMRANIAKLRSLGGWQPAVPLDATLQDMLNCWRAALASDPDPVRTQGTTMTQPVALITGITGQ